MYALPTQAVTHALERGYPAEVLVWACQLLMQLHYAAGMGAYVEDPNVQWTTFLQDCSVINGRLYTLDVFIFEPQDMGRDGAQVLQLHSDRQYDVVLDLTYGDLLRLWSCYRH